MESEILGRLKRFEHNRYVGARDTMRVYDCDDEEQFAELVAREERDEMTKRNLLSSFGPDTLLEATNRGFTA